MTINDQIRKTLRESGEALNLDQLTEANSWDADERKQAGKNLCALRANGEIVTSMSEGRECYGLAPGYKPKQKPRGPGIHVGKSDGGRAIQRSANTADLASYEAAERDAAKIDVLSQRAVEKLTSNASGAGLSIVNVALSAPAVKLLDLLVERGLHGFNRNEAAQWLICRALEDVGP